jgi:hypothetical protein
MGRPSLSIPSHTYVPGPHKSIYHSWANNCAATDTTNGVNRTSNDGTSDSLLSRAALGLPNIAEQSSALALPGNILTWEPTKGSAGPIKSYVFPGNNTGVVRVLRFCSVLSAMTY